MNQGRIWTVVKPTVGLPLLLGTVLVIALLVHAAVLSHTTWFASYWNGSASSAAAPVVAPAPAAEPVAAPLEAAPVAAAPAEAPVAAAAPPVARLYFAVGKSNAWTDGGESLKAVSDYLVANPAATAALSGFHDPTGNLAANEALAKSRAELVRDALVAAGVAAERVSMEKPTETAGSGDPREARRVEVAVRP